MLIRRFMQLSILAALVGLIASSANAQVPTVSSVLRMALGQSENDQTENDQTENSDATANDGASQSATGGQAENDGTAPLRAQAPEIETEVQTKTILELQAAVEQLQRDVTAQTELLRNQTAISGQLSSRIQDNTELINNNMVNLSAILQQQQQILESISSQDSQGRYMPRLDANMANPEFAADLRSAVQKAQPEDGTLVIRNTLPFDQTIVVNGEQHTVVANAFLTVRVPVGTVVTRVPGRAAVNWYIGAPEYTQRVRLTY